MGKHEDELNRVAGAGEWNILRSRPSAWRVAAPSYCKSFEYEAEGVDNGCC